MTVTLSLSCARDATRPTSPDAPSPTTALACSAWSVPVRRSVTDRFGCKAGRSTLNCTSAVADAVLAPSWAVARTCTVYGPGACVATGVMRRLDRSQPVTSTVWPAEVVVTVFAPAVSTVSISSPVSTNFVFRVSAPPGLLRDTTMSGKSVALPRSARMVRPSTDSTGASATGATSTLKVCCADLALEPLLPSVAIAWARTCKVPL